MLRGPGLPRDVLWNLGSFALYAASVLLANLLIARVYGPEPTGLLNLVFGIYVVSTQIAAFGIPFSTLRAASLLSSEELSANTMGKIVGSALAGVALTASAVGLVGLVGTSLLSNALADFEIVPAWLLIVPAIWLGAFNRVLLGVANGSGRLRLFAIAQGMRPLVFLLACATWALVGMPGKTLSLTVTISELFVAVFLLASIFGVGMRCTVSLSTMKWLAAFGIRVMPNTVLAELNVRIGVLVLAFFVNSTELGIFTLATWFVEGTAQLSTALRPVVNRRMARLIALRDLAGLNRLIYCIGGFGSTATAVVALPVGLLYPWIAGTMLARPAFAEGQSAYAIMAPALLIASCVLPFDLILVQTGRPTAYSATRMGLCLLNGAVSLMLVPQFAMIGAAIAYAVTYLAYALIMGRVIAFARSDATPMDPVR